MSIPNTHTAKRKSGLKYRLRSSHFIDSLYFGGKYVIALLLRYFCGKYFSVLTLYHTRRLIKRYQLSKARNGVFPFCQFCLNLNRPGNTAAEPPSKFQSDKDVSRDIDILWYFIIRRLMRCWRNWHMIASAKPEQISMSTCLQRCAKSIRRFHGYIDNVVNRVWLASHKLCDQVG